MSNYINTLTNEYPIHVGDLELMGWSEGEPLPNGVFHVEDTELPSVSKEETFYEDAPKLDNGIWKRVWKIRALTEDELTMFATPLPINPENSIPGNPSDYRWDSETSSWVSLV